MKVNSQLSQAELEIRAWLCPGTPPDRMIEGLMDAYLTRSEPERKAFVTALIGKLTTFEADRVISSALNRAAAQKITG